MIYEEPIGLCHYCGKPFTFFEWDDRHSDSDGEDVHADCCQICKEKAMSSKDRQDRQNYIDECEAFSQLSHADKLKVLFEFTRNKSNSSLSFDETTIAFIAQALDEEYLDTILASMTNPDVSGYGCWFCGG